MKELAPQVRRLTRVVPELEERLASVVRPFSLSMLRISLGVVFDWFCALKVAVATQSRTLSPVPCPGSTEPGS